MSRLWSRRQNRSFLRLQLVRTALLPATQTKGPSLLLQFGGTAVFQIFLLRSGSGTKWVFRGLGRLLRRCQNVWFGYSLSILVGAGVGHIWKRVLWGEWFVILSIFCNVFCCILWTLRMLQFAMFPQMMFFHAFSTWSKRWKTCKVKCRMQ